MAISDGLGIVNKVLGMFSRKERIRRLKNKIDKLEREKSELTINKATRKKQARLSRVIDELNRCNRLLKNFAQD